MYLQENWTLDSFYEVPMSFVPDVFLYKSTIRPCMAYCCHACAGAHC